MNEYLLGHSDAELARLAQQAAYLGELTEDVLRRAGLRPGMRVLDVGCGIGDVTIIAGRLVGPEGSVLGIDRAAPPLALARARAEAAGMPWLRFEQAEVVDFAGAERFDAVVGRLVLVYAPDPSALLRGLLRHVLPGGILAFQEMDISRTGTEPSLRLFDTCITWIRALYARAGLMPDMGSALLRTFRDAGLSPELIGACRVDGADGFSLGWLTQTVRSLLPMMVQAGVATEDAVGIDTLEGRLRAAAAAEGACVICPLMIGAWARVPG